MSTNTIAGGKRQEATFGGVWTYPSLTFPQNNDFMSIDEVRGRIISFIVIGIDPVRRHPMSFWYRPVSATSITTRLRSSETWRINEYEFEGDRLLWKYGGGAHAWRRVPPNERPDWLDAMLMKVYSKMDATDVCA